MRAVSITVHDAPMRPIRVPAALLAASLVSLAVTGCGSQKPGGDAAPPGSSVRAGSSPTATDNSAAMQRFSKLVRTINAECRDDQPADANGKKPPRPEDVPGYEEQPVDGYGPDNPPPTLDGIGPDPNSSEGPPEYYTPDLKPRDFEEIPLDAEDQCIADKHADRIREALGGKGTTSAKDLHSKLTKLDYPASRIHAMPAQGGSPRVRLDLRIDSQTALEIVGTSSTLIIEPFGAVAAPNLKITEIKRKT
jgi:hypothetical protein